MAGRRRGLLALALAFTGCAAPQATTSSAAPTTAAMPPASVANALEPAPAASGEETFRAFMAREATGLVKRPLVFSDGRATGEIEAVATPTLERDGATWLIEAPIGSEHPVSCSLFDKPIEGGASLVRFVDLLRERLGDATVESVTITDGGVIGETAYMAATLTYTTESPRGTAGGQIKMFVRPDLDASVFCFQDEVGYFESFKRVARSLVLSLRVARPSPPPRVVEIQVVKLGDMPIGVVRRTVQIEAAGTRFEQTTSFMVVPRTRTDLISTDRFDAERVDQAGRLISVVSVEARGEEVLRQYDVTRQGHSRVYVYTGKQSGKDLSGKFKSKDEKGLASSSLIARQVRDQLMTGKVAELTVEAYHPSIAPEPLEVVYKRRGADGRDISVRLGAIDATAHLDENGLVDRMSSPIGGMVLTEARVFMRGEP
jgi:hypothetical protein